MLLVNRSDEELCILLKGGDERALQVILQRYWESLYKMAFSIFDDRFICEDVVQNIFIKIWQNRNSLMFTHSLKAYLFASTRYEIYHQVRLKIRNDEKIESVNFDRIEYYNPCNKLEYKQLMDSVQELVGVLPERCRKIYLLSREDRLSNKEIALRMNISIKTVESQITIALRRIREGLNRTSFWICILFLGIILFSFRGIVLIHTLL